MASAERCGRTCKCGTSCRWWKLPAIEQIRELAGEGLSAGRIAKFLGNKTRNQILGLCKRSGIKLNGKGGAPYGNLNAERRRT